MTNTKNKTGWEVRAAKVSERNGGLYIEGTNHETTDPLARTFCWHVGHHSIDDARYDWTGCTFAPGARETLARLLAKRAG